MDRACEKEHGHWGKYLRLIGFIAKLADRVAGEIENHIKI